MMERGRLRIDGGTEASKVEMMSGKHYDEKNAQIEIGLLKAHGEDLWAWQERYSTR